MAFEVVVFLVGMEFWTKIQNETVQQKYIFDA